MKALRCIWRTLRDICKPRPIEFVPASRLTGLTFDDALPSINQVKLKQMVLENERVRKEQVEREEQSVKVALVLLGLVHHRIVNLDFTVSDQGELTLTFDKLFEGRNNPFRRDKTILLGVYNQPAYDLPYEVFKKVYLDLGWDEVNIFVSRHSLKVILVPPSKPAVFDKPNYC